MVLLNWKQCSSYEEAKDQYDCVYLHEWSGKAYYVGVCDRSVFGGNPRKINDNKMNPRYGPSYRHWIDGCLEHGGRLYVAKVSEGVALSDVEDALIAQLHPPKNTSKPFVKEVMVEHRGDVPLCLSRRL
ncbi:MAG: hypothetical protein HYX89_05575 [Chloroflexi bacterium]|nr:hypothetical protein [Chloroflexota bacterium]